MNNALMMALSYHRANLRPCKGSRSMETGSSGCISRKSAGCKLVLGSCAMEGTPLYDFQIGVCSGISLGSGESTCLATYTWPLWYNTLEKPQLQHSSVKVINLKVRIPEFREAERADLQTALDYQDKCQASRYNCCLPILQNRFKIS